VRFENAGQSDLQVYTGRTVDQPSLFVSGARDWGVYQTPGNLERMRDVVCTNLIGCHLLEGAGHWVQQEKAEEVAKLLLELLAAPQSGSAAPDLTYCLKGAGWLSRVCYYSNERIGRHRAGEGNAVDMESRRACCRISVCAERLDI
jgi:hypothetical protein